MADSGLSITLVHAIDLLQKAQHRFVYRYNRYQSKRIGCPTLVRALCFVLNILGKVTSSAPGIGKHRKGWNIVTDKAFELDSCCVEKPH
jgi:hypothetical protein